jgi:hypothetical protein
MNGIHILLFLLLAYVVSVIYGIATARPSPLDDVTPPKAPDRRSTYEPPMSADPRYHVHE